MMNAEISITVAFILFISLSFIHIKKFLSKVINKKIHSIQKTLNESLDVLHDAEAHLSEAIKESKIADKQCEATLKRTKKQVDDLEKRTAFLLKEMEVKKNEMLQQLISSQFEHEFVRLHNEIVALSFSAVEKNLSQDSKSSLQPKGSYINKALHDLKEKICIVS